MPKLILRSEGAFFTRISYMARTFPVEGDEACVAKSHMATSHSIYELMEPLLLTCAGHPPPTLYILPELAVYGVEAFGEFLMKYKVSRLL